MLAHDAGPFNKLEEALGRAPVTSIAAALAKVRWLIEQAVRQSEG
jgi:hypothetical protein